MRMNQWTSDELPAYSQTRKWIFLACLECKKWTNAGIPLNHTWGYDAYHIHASYGRLLVSLFEFFYLGCICYMQHPIICLCHDNDPSLTFVFSIYTCNIYLANETLWLSIGQGEHSFYPSWMVEPRLWQRFLQTVGIESHSLPQQILCKRMNPHNYSQPNSQLLSVYVFDDEHHQ